MQKYSVTGMSCAACSARVEKAVSKLEGVSFCAVNLLTNSMEVDGEVTPAAVMDAVEKAGYGATLQDANGVAIAEEGRTGKRNKTGDGADAGISKRLIASILLLIPLMYCSMGHTMWNMPLPGFMEENPMIVGMIQMLLTVAVMVVNQKFFINGWKGILHGAPNMDTLVAMGSAASFGYSVYVLFCMSDAQMTGDAGLARSYLHELYFESAAMILTLITVGKMLEARAKGKTTSALEGLLKLMPDTATLLRDGKEVVCPVEEVRKGDLFVLRPGEKVPVDAVVTEGMSAVNESALTGESIPADKVPGDKVSAGTLNESGVLTCEATGVGEDTTLARIVHMVGEASASKAPIAKLADRVAGVFVPVVLGIAIVALAVWLLLGESFGFAIARAICVLVISCPCALGLATPVAIMVGTGVGTRKGILFKTATSLEQTGKTAIVALDKTGTITEGNPKVTGIYPVSGAKEELLQLAVSLEKNSEHPLAKAVLQEAEKTGLSPAEIVDFRIYPGNGLECREKETGVLLTGGNMDFMIKSNPGAISEEIQKQAEELSLKGQTPLFFAKDGNVEGIIAVSDRMKEASREAIDTLRKMGIRVVMLTGDNEVTANAIGKEAGVDEVFAGLLPEGKDGVISDLMKSGQVAMVGDGINDAPALTRANIGIAIGAGTDIAIDAADVVLMNSRLSDVAEAVRLSRATFRNIKQNLFWAFFYNVVGIPLAAGLWYPIFGWELNPMFGAAAMSLSSFCVVSNALRLNLMWRRKGRAGEKRKEDETKQDKEIKEKEIITMEKKMMIEGMMCPHCEARVKKCLEELSGVTEAIVSHTEGSAIVKMSEEISDEVLKKTVEEQGYTVK